MAITYHAGRRIQGLSTDETTITPTGYKVHTFNSTGTFTITAGSGSGDVLIIGGGGSGGGAAGGNYGSGGGGGAGDFRKFTNQTLSSGSVVIGNGGSQVASATNGNGGGSSSYNGNSSGGGGGGRNGGTSSAGGTGASGGGGSGDNTGSAGGSSNAVGFGNTGGQGGSKATAAAGGGGGGAGSTGTAGNVQDGGNGGDGKSDSINGTLTFYAAGGGGGRVSAVGGIGGSSIGGNGGFGGLGGGTAGLANTGSGGGGGGSGGATSTNIGLAGGQGVVIISYLNDGSITATGGTITTPSTTTTGVKPTNAQVGSRFEETDTRKMYHYSATLILEDDFSGSDSWTDRGTTIAVSTSNDRIDWDVGNGAGTNHDGTWYDLGAGVVNTTKWVLTAKIHVADWTANSDSSCHIGVGLTDTKDVAYTTSQDSISLAIGVGNNDNRIYGHHSDSQEALDAQRDIFTITPSSTFASATSVWLKLVRNGSNTMIASLYSNEAMTTLLEEKTTTMAGTPANLRYIMVNGRQQNVNAMDGYVDDIKFYNGITTAESPVWKELGT